MIRKFRIANSFIWQIFYNVSSTLVFIDIILKLVGFRGFLNTPYSHEIAAFCLLFIFGVLNYCAYKNIKK